MSCTCVRHNLGSTYVMHLLSRIHYISTVEWVAGAGRAAGLALAGRSCPGAELHAVGRGQIPAGPLLATPVPPDLRSDF